MAGLIAPVARLIEEFSKLPGVGRKTAQRLTYHMLRAPADEARALAAALVAVKEEVAYCSTCCNITDAGVDPCAFCADDRRDATRICVVEEPLDVLAIDRTGEYRGRYHVLHGAISPIDGIGPERLRTGELMSRVREGGVEEVILATNPNLEGEATAMYLADKNPISVSPAPRAGARGVGSGVTPRGRASCRHPVGRRGGGVARGWGGSLFLGGGGGFFFFFPFRGQPARKEPSTGAPSGPAEGDYRESPSTFRRSRIERSRSRV